MLKYTICIKYSKQDKDLMLETYIINKCRFYGILKIDYTIMIDRKR